MSWTLSCTAENDATLRSEASTAFEAQLDNVRDENGNVPDWYCEAEVREQFEQAVSAAQRLAESATTGDAPYNVMLSGHANPRHVPRDGYSNDTITVSVSSAAQPAQAPTGETSTSDAAVEGAAAADVEVATPETVPDAGEQSEPENTQPPSA